jgi:hypothetical protein
MVLDVPLDEMLPVSPASTLKLYTSGLVSNEMSFLGEMEHFALLCESLPLKKNGSLLVIPLDGGEVTVELDEAVDSCFLKNA